MKHYPPAEPAVSAPPPANAPSAASAQPIGATGSPTDQPAADHTRPRVLVIAGYDQSAGAGLLSDIKTLETQGVYGFGVCTGFTFQNERTISRIQWFSEQDIFEQIDLCFASAVFDWVKIGITPSMNSAASIIRHLRQHNPGVKVVLDPVIKATSGQDFWTGLTATQPGLTRSDDWEAVAAQCYLITPNWEEMSCLYPGEDILQKCQSLTQQPDRHIYLKGGHHPQTPGRDYLWSNGEVQLLDPIGAPITTSSAEGRNAPPVHPKHGSGCVLSSALTAGLALGYPLPVAAERAKRYTEQFLTSNKTLLGWHRPLENPI